ncbi:MAG: site-specific integrase, partial [Gemmatimonadetes bacterium]|nr:site-specific integrase [Gemmatimonadota bacterium]
FNFPLRVAHSRHAKTNPAAELKLEREHNGREWFLTHAEAEILVAAVDAWLYPLVIMALTTGARRGELMALTWGDIDFRRGLVVFRMTKNGEPRTIKMSATARATLKAIETRTPTPAARVFRNRTGGRVSKSGIAYAWEKATKAANLDGFRFHDLRHSAASFMVQAGVPLNTVRVVLGHKSLTMTLRYAHLAPDHQADAMAALDAVFESPVKSPVTHPTTAGLQSP